MARSVEYLVIGAGIAGLSTAAHLVLDGSRDVLVLDREPQIGFYASSHNAAIARQLTGHAAHTALTVEGRGRLEGLGLMESPGGILLAAEHGGLESLAEEAREFGIAAKRYNGSPYSDCLAAETLEVPSDGVVALDGLLNCCFDTVKTGGGEVRTGCRVHGISTNDGGCTVETDMGPIKAKAVINAAGAWAGQVGEMASATPIAFRPMRRHLVWSATPYPKGRPWTWWADRPFYMRPESGGVLMSPLDETEVSPPPLNIQPPVDQDVLAVLGETLTDVAPSLAEYPINRLWCGLRTFSPDRAFVIGWDKTNPHHFWVAGLGGHGITSGLAVGGLASDMIRRRGAGPRVLNPARFAD